MKIKFYLCHQQSMGKRSQYPLGLGYLLTNCYAETEVVTSPEDLVDCDLIGLSADASGTREAVEIMQATDIPVVVGGHATLWEPLQEYDFAHIVLGEGEVALQQIVDGGAEKVIRAEPIADLDGLRFPERGKCDVVVPVLTSRGCPWSCKFCSSSAFWGNVRYHSPQYFIDEVNYVARYYPRAREIYVIDDLFTASKERFYAIAELWMREGLHRRWRLNSFIRSNTFDFKMGRTMKSMGFRNVRFGLETASDRLLESINKQTTAADHQRVIDICNDLGLPVGYSVLWGLPGETLVDQAMTVNFINKNRQRAQIQGNYQFQAMPGTAFYDGKSPIDNDLSIYARGVCPTAPSVGK